MIKIEYFVGNSQSIFLTNKSINILWQLLEQKN